MADFLAPSCSPVNVFIFYFQSNRVLPKVGIAHCQFANSKTPFRLPITMPQGSSRRFELPLVPLVTYSYRLSARS